MSKAQDEAAKKTVIDVISNKNIWVIKSYTLKGYYFNHLLFGPVIINISLGQILVKYDSNLSATGEYDMDHDTLYLKFTEAKTLSRKALVVHEVVHAFFDSVKETKMKVRESEALAYIAQCQYARGNNPNPGQRLMSNNKTNDKVFEIAWDLAGKIQSGQKPTDKEYEKLMKAVDKHSNYKNNHNDNAGCNGIKKKKIK